MTSYIARRLLQMAPLMIGISMVVFALILTKTPFGRHLFLIGGNVTAAFRAGIKVGGVVFVTFVLSGALAGFAGAPAIQAPPTNRLHIDDQSSFLTFKQLNLFVLRLQVASPSAQSPHQSN